MTAETEQPRATLWRRARRWARRIGLSRRLPMALTIAAIVSGVTTYAALTESRPFGGDPRVVLVLLYIDLALALVLSAVVLGRLVKLWIERRRGTAGSRLHIRLVAMFSVVAVAPAIIVAVFSVSFFNLGIEAWFSKRVSTAIGESLAVAEAYLDEHRNIIRADAKAMANDISRSGARQLANPAQLNRLLATQAALRSLNEALVFTRDGSVLGRAGFVFSLIFEPVALLSMRQADSGEVVILTSDTDDRVRALMRLDVFGDVYLMIGRFVDPRVIGHMERTQRAVSAYQRLEGDRSKIQITFALIFAVVTLLLLLAAVWLGLNFATQLVRPISALIGAAERIREGDLTARVKEQPTGDEIGSLSRAFNRMANQLESQRQELLETNLEIEARQRFTESVLSGVSAGVIGLDSEGRVELPNRFALDFLATRADRLIGRPLIEIMPEVGELIEQVKRRPDRRAETQITIERRGRTRTLLVRVGAEQLGHELEGFVVTFDDISALVAAERTAAWADVARRIAHEIKNPLTPIQLSAERLRRKYQHEIKSDPEVFISCTDTIVRQVGDIGRMIDEFSAFARMPAPVFRTEAVVDLVRQAIDLQEVEHPEIRYIKKFPDHGVMLHCDGRQIVQVMTNVLRNAADAIAGRAPSGGEMLDDGWIRIVIDHTDAEHVVIEVEDNGRGFPDDARDRLVEPYITTRAKGTGLGLAIVKKIIEDHGGELVLDDGADGGAKVRIIFRTAESETSVDGAGRTSPKVVSHGG